MTPKALADIKRRSVKIEFRPTAVKKGAPRQSEQSADQSEITALVINSSQEMAKEITMQLTLTMPGCSITYAPTLQVAKWILAKKRIDLIVSSPVLPDGGIARLNSTLQEMNSPPDVVVVGGMTLKNKELLRDSGYQFATVRHFNKEAEKPKLPTLLKRLPPLEEQPSSQEKIKSLGADIRNDLNNPLQEIVAMVFVAQATGTELAPGTSQALKAIEGAAKNMASVVRGLEDKIRVAVSE